MSLENNFITFDGIISYFDTEGGFKEKEIKNYLRKVFGNKNSFDPNDIQQLINKNNRLSLNVENIVGEHSEMHLKYFYVVFYKSNTNERYKTPMFRVDENNTIKALNSLEPFYYEFLEKNARVTFPPGFMELLFKMNVDVDNAQEKVRYCNGFDYAEYDYFVDVTYDIATDTLVHCY